MSDKSTVCPWCDTEIVWDPELGPEDTCPHCLNELTDYRKVTLGSADLDDPDDRYRPEDADSADETDFAENEERLDWGELDGDDLPEAQDLIAYEEGVERQTDEQEDSLECPACFEAMVLAGEEIVADAGFQSAKVVGTGEPLLPSTFRLQLYICPNCFRAERVLGEAEREGWMQRLSRGRR